MVKYMSIEEQVDKEFLRARNRAFFIPRVTLEGLDTRLVDQ
jgi:hypothetical protein